MALIRYIHLNPLRAGLVKDPDAYPYSGHRAYLGADRGGLVDAGPILSMLGGRSAYRRFVRGGIGAGHEERYYQTEDQQFLGARGFAQKLGQPAAQLAVEPPKRPLTMALGDLSRRCALDLSVLRSPDRGHAVSRARAALSFVLVRRLGYRVADVAAAFHRDAATISVMVSREARRLESSPRRTADASRIHRNV
jgi:putative transposase